VGQRAEDLRRRREELFAGLVQAFARGDHAALEAGVRPDVELTLGGTSWLAGKYRGYEEFRQYVAGAALILGRTEGQLSYHHVGDEMTVIHDFLVGPPAVRIALHEVIAFDAEGRVQSLFVRPWDQAKFDEAVNAFLATPGSTGEYQRQDISARAPRRDAR
jgi:hypothetical protein